MFNFTYMNILEVLERHAQMYNIFNIHKTVVY